MWHLPFRTSKEGGKNYESHKNVCSGASLYCLCTGRDHCHQRRINTVTVTTIFTNWHSRLSCSSPLVQQQFRTHFKQSNATTNCKCWDTPTKKRPFLLQIAASHRSVRCDTNLPPPVPFKVVPRRFERGLVLLATLIRGGGGIASTRSWIGHLRQSTVQCLKYFYYLL